MYQLAKLLLLWICKCKYENFKTWCLLKYAYKENCFKPTFFTLLGWMDIMCSVSCPVRNFCQWWGLGETCEGTVRSAPVGDRLFCWWILLILKQTIREIFYYVQQFVRILFCLHLYLKFCRYKNILLEYLFKLSV